MSAMACEFCGSPAHVWFDCKKKPDGWKPERMKSTAARKDVQGGRGAGKAPAKVAAPALSPIGIAGTQAPPVETKRRGRPRIHPDRKAYKAAKERERRAKK